MTTNDKPVCDRDVDLMRDVYMTREQRAAHNRILDAAMRPQPAAPQAPEGWRDALTETDTDLNRLLANIIDAEKRDPKWEGMADIVRGWIARNRAAIATPPAPEQPKPECPCGEATCEEPWEPGCGLGRSDEHVGVYEQPKPAGDVEAVTVHDFIKLDQYLADAGHPDFGDARMTLLAIRRRLAAQPAQGEGEK